MMTKYSSSDRISALADVQISRLEAALRHEEKLALMGRITASVIHEILNPAEAIGNLVYLIANNSDDPELIKSLSKQIEEQLLRIRYVSRHTLSYFRESPQRLNSDLIPLVETAIRYHGTMLLERKIEIRRQLPESVNAAIYPGDFLQIVSNLLRNSIDALESGGTICLRVRNSKGKVRFTIADNGCGIPGHLRPRLFEPFQTTKTETGNGLGLWICKSAIERHRGRIAWRSSTDPRTHGTIFCVSFAN